MAYKRKKIGMLEEDFFAFKEYLERSAKRTNDPFRMHIMYVHNNNEQELATWKDMAAGTKYGTKSSCYNFVYIHENNFIIINRFNYIHWLYLRQDNGDRKRFIKWRDETSNVKKYEFIILRINTSNDIEPEEEDKEDISVNGKTAFNYIMKKVKSKYTDEEIQEIVKQCEENTKDKVEEVVVHKQGVRQVVKNPNKDNQEKHFLLSDLPSIQANKIYEFDHCYYFDINSAHLYQLSVIFPRCEKIFKGLRSRINQFKTSGNKDEARKFKNLVNFAVGEMCNEGMRAVRNQIVCNVRAMIEKSIAETHGDVIYANTDGYYVQDPENVYTKSNRLGDMKTELSDGKIYFTYVDLPNETPYYLYQFTDDSGDVIKKGNFPISYRDDVDLSKGKIVHYLKEMIYDEISGTYTCKFTRKGE